MTIPMLSGWADSLKDLPTLGNNLAHILNPNMDVQQRLKAAIASDPNIAQQLANMEAQNPGTIAHIFGTNNSGVNSIANIKPDANTQINMAIAPKLPGLLADPNNMQDILENRTGIKSPEQRQAEQQRLTLSDQQIKLNEGELADKEQERQREVLAKTALGKKAFNPATFNTDYTPEEQAAILGSKRIGSSINRQLLEYSRQQDRKFEVQMRREDRADAKQVATDNFIRNRTFTMALQVYQDSNGAITLPDAIKLSSPEGQAQADTLLANPQTANTSLAKARQFQLSMQKLSQDKLQATIDATNRRDTGRKVNDPAAKTASTLLDGVSKDIASAQGLIDPARQSGRKPADVNVIYPYLQSANTKLAMLGNTDRYAYVASENKIIRVPNGASRESAVQGPPQAAGSAGVPPEKPGAIAPNTSSNSQKTLSPAAEKAKTILQQDPSQKSVIIEKYPDVAKELGLI